MIHFLRARARFIVTLFCSFFCVLKSYKKHIRCVVFDRFARVCVNPTTPATTTAGAVPIRYVSFIHMAAGRRQRLRRWRRRRCLPCCAHNNIVAATSRRLWRKQKNGYDTYLSLSISHRAKILKSCTPFQIRNVSRLNIMLKRVCVCHNRRTIAIKTQHKKLAHGVNWAHFPSLLHFSHESMRDLRGCLFASNMLPMARSTGRYFELCELCAWRRVDVYELGTAVKCSQLKSNVERFAVYTMKLFYSFIKRRKTISKSTR